MKTTAHKAETDATRDARPEGAPLAETATPHAVEATVIPTELRETEREFVVRFDIPGAARDSLRVNWVNHTLQIEGHHAAPHEGGRVHLNERPGGVFRRAMPLPADAAPQGIRASYVDGVLTVLVPKTPIN